MEPAHTGVRDAWAVRRVGTNAAMPAPDTLLASAERCLLAYRGDDGPAMTPMACWSDGGGLWMTTSRQATEIIALRRDPRCAVWIQPPSPAEPGVAIDGSARIFDLSDPVGFWLHSATISAALAALALTHRSALAGYLRDLPQLPATWMLQRRALIRVRVDRARSRLAPQQVTGVGPVLPAVLPAGVRRSLTGARHVTLAVQRGDALSLQPAVWSAGYVLDLGDTVVKEPVPAPDAPACVVVVDEHVDGRPWSRSALLLCGTIDTGSVFRPTRATWWQGISGGSAPVSAPATTSGIVLPD